jgi:predicted N-acyltransferase
VTVEIVDTLARVAPAEWNRLAGDDPFLSHEFLSALHETGCASPETGWTPRYLMATRDGACGWAPTHSSASGFPPGAGRFASPGTSGVLS